MNKCKKLLVLLICAAMLYPAPVAFAAPKGGKVVGGNAHINQSGSATTINQTSDRAIINWNSFDIGKKESVQHNMPSSNSAGLHRVVGGGGPSQIEGLLQSNGNVYLVNPAGVVIHNGAKVDVNGFVATSRDIANENFMKGNMVFDKPGMPGAAIINQGNISLKDNGLGVLVAPTVRNDGIIAGKLGKIALGGSDQAWKLDMTGDDLIAFTLDENAVDTLHTADGTPLSSVQNNGQIKAEGGVVVMTASQLDGFVGSVVNNGEISAASAEARGGKIIFRGQVENVDVVNNGRLDVSSKTAEGGTVRLSGQGNTVNAGTIDATGATKGGQVVITGRDITLKSGSVINASGDTGGGEVLVGGNARGKGPEPNAKIVQVQSDAEILADARLIGNGGQIVVWADEKTQFDGKATARGGEQGGDGGMVETSAKLLIIGDPAVVNTSAKRGKAGTWLLDPEDFVIAAADGNISGKTISENLEDGDVEIKVRGDEGDSESNIIVNDLINWNANTILKLEANGDILIDADIKASGDYAGVNFISNNGSFILRNGKIILTGNAPIFSINNDIYEVINSISKLETLTLQKDGKYILGCDIDGNDSINEYFSPITSDDDRTSYVIFEGLGNAIKNIKIYSELQNVGLFSIFNGTIRNLTLSNIYIISNLNYAIGTLAGIAEGIIDNVHVNIAWF